MSKYSDAKHGKFIFQSNHLDLVADQFSAESKYTLRDRAGPRAGHAYSGCRTLTLCTLGCITRFARQLNYTV